MLTGKNGIIILRLKVRKKRHWNLNTRRTGKVLRFTLIELLMAMAVFTIIALIMMRFFSSAQQIYSKVSQRNSTFSDARIALDMMTRELQCALYNNSGNPTGIYPFWLQKRQFTSADHTTKYYTTASHWDTLEWNQLNFISATDMQPAGAVSNVCEVRYTFVPAGETIATFDKDDLDIGGNAPNPINIQEGWLIRSCTADKIRNSDLGSYEDNAKWNFYLIPYKDSAGVIVDNSRITNIYKDDTSSNVYQQVISGVYALNFTCFIVDPEPLSPTYLQLVPLKAMINDANGTLSTIAGTFGSQSSGAPPALPTPQDGNINTLIGTPFPVAIKIDLSVMQPSDWREWHDAINRNDISTADKIKGQRMRTFSRTVYLDSKVSN